MTEWDWDKALAAYYEDGKEDGIEQGIVKGREEGRVEGREKGRVEGREEIARNALAKGIPPDMVHEITGLDLETIQSFK
jgi:predicted transposase/invertase (TIGR01784 family)